MSFWDLSDNTKAESTTTFEAAPQMEPIPAGTGVLAAPDEAAWAEYQGEEYISIRWVVLAPADYKNRKVFQKVKVYDADPKKADKAKRMLAAIDANAGGQLMAGGGRPTNEDLARCLVNKPMQLRLEVWQTEDKTKAGNWVAAVAPKNAQAATQPAQSEKEDDVPW